MADAFNQNLAGNRYYDRDFKVDAAKILPGEYFVTDHDMALVTVLGSCVAACIRDAETGIGGMNHFMLPDVGGRGRSGAASDYGLAAMKSLIDHLLQAGARRHRLEAKVFGGAALLGGLTSSQVGARNAAFVLDYLKTERILVVARDLLGSQPRKLYYFPASGRALVKKLRRMPNDASFAHTRGYEDRLSGDKAANDIARRALAHG
ncbi:MAG: chemoreceptor glutamine deamidase CheD [Azonexus sp.]|nr:chemoreceptor glutamine deamidase CheD [Azonexus sp.]